MNISPVGLANTRISTGYAHSLFLTTNFPCRSIKRRRHNINQIHNNVLWDGHYTTECSPNSDWLWEIFRGILLVPHDIVIDMNNVVQEEKKPCLLTTTWCFYNGELHFTWRHATYSLDLTLIATFVCCYYFFKLASNILVYIKERVCSRGHWKYNHWGKMWSTTPSPISHCCPPFLWISQQGGVRSDPKEHAKLYLYGRSDSLCSCWHQNRPKIRTVSPKTKVRWGGLKGGQTEIIVHGGLILGPKPHP